MSTIQRYSDYTIVESTKQENLIDYINDRLEEGYVLIGGPFTTIGRRVVNQSGAHDEITSHQAIAKIEEPLPKLKRRPKLG